MRAGLFLAYWPSFSPEEQVEPAVLGAELRVDSMWASVARGQDAVPVLGLLAGATLETVPLSSDRPATVRGLADAVRGSGGEATEAPDG